MLSTKLSLGVFTSWFISILIGNVLSSVLSFLIKGYYSIFKHVFLIMHLKHLQLRACITRSFVHIITSFLNATILQIVFIFMQSDRVVGNQVKFKAAETWWWNEITSFRGMHCHVQILLVLFFHKLEYNLHSFVCKVYAK